MYNLKELGEIPKMYYKQNKMDQTRFQMNSLTTVKLRGCLTRAFLQRQLN